MYACKEQCCKITLIWKVKERGLIGIEGCVERKKIVPHACIQESIEWMLKAASNEKVSQGEENLKDCKQSNYQEKEKNSKEKALRIEFNRQTEEIGTDESWR